MFDLIDPHAKHLVKLPEEAFGWMVETVGGLPV
jgi:hypothetical protein